MTEAKILCGSLAPNDIPEYAEELSSSPVDESQEGIIAEEHDRQQSHFKLNYLTWKLSNTMGFSYGATLPRRHAHHRQPNPFGPRSSAESSSPLQPSSSRAALLKKPASDTKHFQSLASQELIREASLEHVKEAPSQEHHDLHALVSPHPPHPVWDDEPNQDTPYDNPYYTRSISDTLWLPRDPTGILNLDDTVDLRVSITSEPGAGRLGVWDEEEFIGSALSSVFAGSFGSADDTSSVRRSSAQVDGTEVINLPPGIASRVEASSRESGAASNLHPRLPLGKVRTSSNSTRRPIVFRRASAPLEDSSHASPRSVSQGSQPGSSIPRPDPSYFSLPPPRSRHRGPSFSTLGVGSPSEIPVQRVSTLAASIRSRATSGNFPHSPGMASIISTRDAVVEEAIAEEQEVVAEQSRKEECEQERAKPRSWLTSWMYSSVR